MLLQEVENFGNYKTFDVKLIIWFPLRVVISAGLLDR